MRCGRAFSAVYGNALDFLAWNCGGQPHLSDYVEGWIYVISIGVAAGMVGGGGAQTIPSCRLRRVMKSRAGSEELLIHRLSARSSRIRRYQYRGNFSFSGFDLRVEAATVIEMKTPPAGTQPLRLRLPTSKYWPSRHRQFHKDGFGLTSKVARQAQPHS